MKHFIEYFIKHIIEYAIKHVYCMITMRVRSIASHTRHK